jgi:hypothetical protein
MNPQVSLAGQLFLLSHSAETHAPFINIPTLSTALAGAVVAELILGRQVCITDGLVETYQPTGDRDRSLPVTDPVAAEVLAMIRTGIPMSQADGVGQHQRRYVSYPARELLTMIRPDIYDRTQATLVGTGVLARTSRSFLGVRFGSRYAPTDPAAVIRIRGAVRYTVQGSSDPDLATRALCALIRAVRLIDALYLGSYTTTDLINRLNFVVHQVAAQPAPYAGIADVAAAVESLAGDIAVAVYR